MYPGIGYHNIATYIYTDISRVRNESTSDHHILHCALARWLRRVPAGFTSSCQIPYQVTRPIDSNDRRTAHNEIPIRAVHDEEQLGTPHTKAERARRCIPDAHPCHKCARRSSLPQSCPWRQASHFLEFQLNVHDFNRLHDSQRAAIPFTIPRDYVNEATHLDQRLSRPARICPHSFAPHSTPPPQ